MVNVKSEISTLKKVMLHAPNKELEVLTKDNMNDFLFDELLDISQAKMEYNNFVNILKDNGVEVVFVEELMVETLKRNKDIKADFINDIINEKDEEIIAYLNGLSEEELVEISIKGLIKNERSIINPLPNLYFQRDPQMIIGNGVCINHMSTSVRKNESILTKYIFKYHPDYINTKIFYEPENGFNIEGGDILNLTSKVILIGISERTSIEGIKSLASYLFIESEIETIIAIEIPKKRASMHLDTIITQVDYDKFVIYTHDFENTQTHIITKDNEQLSNRPLKDTLIKYLNLNSITFICCEDEIEQWNDAVNTLALKPGKVIAYKINEKTNKLLRQNGIEVIELEAKQLGMGRGGIHCMSQPLIRE